MKNWSYKELIDTIKESYYDLLNQSERPDQAISRVFEDFYFYPEIENRVENLITSISTINLRLENLGYVYHPEVEFLNKQLEVVTDNMLEKELSIEEMKDLKQELSSFFDKLDTIEIRSVHES